MGDSTHSSHCDGLMKLAFVSNRYDCRYEGLTMLLARRALNSFMSRTLGCRLFLLLLLVVVLLLLTPFGFAVAAGR